MSAFSLITDEEKATNLILILDKEGVFGVVLAEKLSQEGTVILVSKRKTTIPKIIHIPFHKEIPHIPEGAYSHMFVFLDQGNQTHELLSPILKKAREDKSRVVCVVPKEIYTKQLQEKILEEKGSLCILGDVYGNKEITSPVMLLFEEARRGEIVLFEMGLGIVYPVSFEETMHAILSAGFSGEKKNILFAFTKHPFTQLSIAHALQKVEPFIKIDFSTHKPSVVNTHENADLPEGEFLVNQKDELKNIQKSFQEVLPQGELSKAEENKKENSKRSTFPHKKSPMPLVLFVFLFLIVAPYVGCLFSVGVGGLLLQSVKTQAANLSFPEAKVSAQASGVFFSLAQAMFLPVKMELEVVGLTKFAKVQEENIQNSYTISQAATALLDAGIYLKKIQQSQSYTSLSDGSLIVNDIKQAGLFIATLKTGEGIWYSNQIQNAQKAFPVLTNIADGLPKIFGISKKQNYLFLFQNNMELRPGGGFIGSYGLITIDKGNVGKLAVHDVYDADGQLHGHIEPPFILRRYIPIQHWYLRDSNFDVDFQKDAQNAAFFLKSETGQEVDGVIAVDLSFVRDVLKGIGPVYVPEYNQTISADNFFEITESHAEKNFFPGSTQKKDFLTSLFATIQTKILGSKDKLLSLVPAVLSSLDGKHVLMSFADNGIQQEFTANGLSASLWDGRVPQQNSMNNFVGINEANIGVNKVNAFVTRSVGEHVTVDEKGAVTGILHINYDNVSKGEWPGGDYKMYLRVILPQDAQVTTVAVDGKEQAIISAVTDPKIFEAKGFVPPPGLEVDKINENGKSLFGFVVIIPSSTKKTIDIHYSLANKIDMTQFGFIYDEIFLKQPGVESYPFTFMLSYPDSFTILKRLNGEALVNGSITKTVDVNKDINLKFNITKK